ncbi:transcription factor Ouib-like [Drosophila tropicalis]|uniref:transcription factor Ouib-like n=1 Tax=Drosophila tropicalis TaxID=46794 RepID=UPI0035AC1FF4
MYELRKLCRACGKNADDSMGAELFEQSNEQLLSVLEDITNLSLEYDNILPESVCHECKTFLNKIVEFRTKCLKTHKELLERKRIEIEEADIHDDYEVTYEATETDELHTEVDLDNEAIQAEIELDEEQELINASPTVKKTKKSPKKSMKRKKSQKTWICELCGGEFKCSTYLKLHLLRHTGKKDVECDICQAKYYTENEMRRHRILHTDARPYACRYCNKTFRGCSSKVVHERTHTNERPFACQFCDKTFRSTSSKQNHEKIHLNNRNFHCETCDQWFLRSSHLLLHSRTKLHMKRLNNDNTNS